MFGKIEYDETRVANITAWVPGRIDRLFVDFTGIMVKEGERMFSLYSPELVSTQMELLQSARALRSSEQSGLASIQEATKNLMNASRQRMRLWGFSPEQIDEIIKRGRPTEHMDIHAPISGVVVRKDALEGMYVQTGTRIYTIVDLSNVWVRLDAYESDLLWIRKDQELEFQVEAYPGEIFRGTVDFIDPFLNPETRTVKVRLDTPNPDGKLKPEMFVRATLHAALSEIENAEHDEERERLPLVIPGTAPLITGERAVVYVAVPGAPGTYEGREIVLGPRAGDYYVVRSGLREGEHVVTHGNFKIDSAIQILARPSMMTPEGGGGGMEHQHGPAPQAQARAEEASAKVPPSFSQQLEPVLAAYQNISRSVESEDLERARTEFSGLKRIVDAIDMSSLSGHARMLWTEYAMLLRNDAVVGSDARSRKEANRALEVLSGHIGRMRQDFGLDHANHEEAPASPTPAHPDRIHSGHN
jgi:Cu(I)/Ag(I) efflux system membrane fusion protein